MRMTHRLIPLVLAASVVLTTPLMAFADQVKLEEGTKLRLRVEDTLSSATSHEGDDVNLKVSEDVLSPDGKTILIKAGTSAYGTVSNVEARKRAGGKGELNFALDNTKAVDGTKVPLRGTSNRDGEDRLGSTIALSLIISPLFLLRKGKDAKILAGTQVTAFTDRDILVNVPVVSANPEATTPAATVDVQKEAPDYLKKYLN